MTRPIELLYRNAVSFSSQALALKRSLELKVTRAFWDSPWDSPDEQAVRRAWKDAHPLVDYITTEMKAFLEQHASRRERKNPFFPLVTSESPLESLARELQTSLELDLSDVRNLKAIHELKKPSLQDIRSAVIARWTGLLFVLGFLLRTVPESFVEQFGGEYKMYQFWVFWYWLLALLVFSIPLVVAWRAYTKAGREHTFLPQILGYCTIQLESRDGRRNSEAARERGSQGAG